jgi:hypothetical protein
MFFICIPDNIINTLQNKTDTYIYVVTCYDSIIIDLYNSIKKNNYHFYQIDMNLTTGTKYKIITSDKNEYYVTKNTNYIGYDNYHTFNIDKYTYDNGVAIIYQTLTEIIININNTIIEGQINNNTILL